MQTVQTNTRITLNNVLLATDFSQASKLALPYAIALARQYGAKVFMARAISPEPHLSVTLDPLPAEGDPVQLDAARDLADFARTESFGYTPHEELLERGDLWTVISDVNQKHRIDLIVAGTHGRQGLRKLILGAKAEKIYRRASCPVLTISPNVRPLRSSIWKLKRILFPTDRSLISLTALPYALSLAEENEAILTVVQFMPLSPPENREADEAIAGEALRALIPAEAAAWCKPEFLVRFEFPGEGILRLAGEREVDLIVMGVCEESRSKQLPWPVASQVVAEARCPVLTVRGSPYSH
jgi:nucleotide-binding universal stress UspA family protein